MCTILVFRIGAAWPNHPKRALHIQSPEEATCFIPQNSSTTSNGFLKMDIRQWMSIDPLLFHCVGRYICIIGSTTTGASCWLAEIPFSNRPSEYSQLRVICACDALGPSFLYWRVKLGHLQRFPPLFKPLIEPPCQAERHSASLKHLHAYPICRYAAAYATMHCSGYCHHLQMWIAVHAVHVYSTEEEPSPRNRARNIHEFHGSSTDTSVTDIFGGAHVHQLVNLFTCMHAYSSPG